MEKSAVTKLIILLATLTLVGCGSGGGSSASTPAPVAEAPDDSGDSTGDDTGSDTGGDAGDDSDGDSGNDSGGDSGGTPEPIEPQIVIATSFETNDTQGWVSNNADSTVAASEETSKDDSYSLKITGRTQSWQGPIYSFLADIEDYNAYDISVFVKLASSTNDRIQLTVKINQDGQDHYIPLNSMDANDQDWVEISGTFYNHQVTNLTNAEFYIEGPQAGVDFYVDQVTVALNSASGLEDYSDVNVTSLHSLADFPIGVAVPAGNAPNSVLDNQNRSDIATTHFDQLTAENIMKMNAIQPTQGVFTFDDANALMDYAQDNNQTVHCHTLIWHSQVPNWLQQFSGTTEQWNELLEQHVTQVATEFAGECASWDVVNEAFHENGQYRGTGSDNEDSSVWFENLGAGYIQTAFEKARLADPSADLYYNDFSLSSNPTKMDAVVDMVQQLQQNNVPIDGVGMQMHINDVIPSISVFAEQLSKLVTLGVKVKITELDIRMNASQNIAEFSPYLAERQKQRYYDIVKTYLDTVPAEQRGGISVWGIADHDSWILQLWDEPDWPLLFNSDYQGKPALQGFADALIQP